MRNSCDGQRLLSEIFLAPSRDGLTKGQVYGHMFEGLLLRESTFVCDLRVVMRSAYSEFAGKSQRDPVPPLGPWEWRPFLSTLHADDPKRGQRGDHEVGTTAFLQILYTNYFYANCESVSSGGGVGSKRPGDAHLAVLRRFVRNSGLLLDRALEDGVTCTA